MSSNNATEIPLLMVPFFHFTGGDHLLFKTWHPTSGGVIGGACVGMFLFAIFERWVHAVSPVLIYHLVQRKSRSYTRPKPSKDCSPCPQHSSKSSEISINVNEKRRLPYRTTPPFIAGVDIPRGILYAFQRLLGFALMLAVMTFQAGYFLAIIAGLTLGEILFGRVPYGVLKDNR